MLQPPLSAYRNEQLGRYTVDQQDPFADQFRLVLMGLLEKNLVPSSLISGDITLLGVGTGDELAGIDSAYHGVDINAIDFFSLKKGRQSQKTRELLSAGSETLGTERAELVERYREISDALLHALDRLPPDAVCNYRAGDFNSPHLTNEMAPKTSLLIARHLQVFKTKDIPTAPYTWGHDDLASITTPNAKGIASWIKEMPVGSYALSTTYRQRELEVLLRGLYDEGIPVENTIVIYNPWGEIVPFDFNESASYDRYVVIVKK